MPQAARKSSVLMYVFAFPMLIVPFAIYNMIAYLMNMDFHQTVFSVPLISGHMMQVSTGDILVLLGVILLYVEILKSTRFSSKAISTFLILTALSFVDVVGGFTITIRTAQRDVTFEGEGRTAS
jgi:hypothetical protein